jgi:hypothetical protein
MPKANKEKIDYVKELLEQKTVYRDIQEKLINKFGSGMSNSTLKKMQKELDENTMLKSKIKQLEYEVNHWKSLYFELKEATLLKFGRENNEH